MPVLALALSAVLVHAPAPNSAVAEGPTAAPTIGVAWPAATQGPVPLPLRWKGTGLLVSAGILGGVGLGLNFTRVGIARHECAPDADDACYSNVLSLIVIGPAALASNTAAFALAAGGAGVRGRWAAHEAAYRGGRQQAARTQIGVGAALMTLGIAGYAAVRIVSWMQFMNDFSCDERYPDDFSGYSHCYRSRWSGYLAGITMTQAASVVGVGLLAHGATYHRNLKRLRGAAGRVALRPTLTRDFAGLTLAGRF